MSANPIAPVLRILRMAELERKVGLKKTQIYDLISKGQFPRGVKLSTRATGWFEHEIDAFLLARGVARTVESTETNLGASVGASDPLPR